jgi:uncharacterized protein YkwD
LKYNVARYLALIILLPLLFFAVPEPASGDNEVLKFDETRAMTLMLNHINRIRAEAGLHGLVLDVDLSRVCREHSGDMAERDFFGHVDPDGEGANCRVRKAGLNCLVTENVGVYRADGASLARVVSDLMDGFLGSEPHLANVLDRNATHIGIGFYQDASNRSTVFGDEKEMWGSDGYGTIFVTQNFYRLEIFEMGAAESRSGVIAGQELELSIRTASEFDILSLHFEKEGFFSEEYLVKAEQREKNEYICIWSFPEEGRWSCKVIGVYDPENGFARGIGQMEFVVE